MSEYELKAIPALEGEYTKQQKIYIYTPAKQPFAD